MRLPLQVKAQSGMSLIQLLIGLAIAIIALTAIIKVFTEFQFSQNQRNAQASLSDATQTLTQTVARKIALAGKSQTPIALPTISGSDNTGVNNSDVLNIAVQGSNANPVYDCEGNLIPADQTEILSLAINSQYQLTCQGVPILNNIAAMQVLYGLDEDGNGTVDRYAANTSGSNLNMNQVKSLRLGFLVLSDPTIPSTAATANILGQLVSTPANRSHQTYITTLKLGTQP